MEIEFIQSGGVGGLTMRTTAVEGEVTGAELDALRSALGKPAPQPRGADRFQYDLVLHDTDRAQTATFIEGAVPAELETLIRRLSARATPSP